MVLCAFNIHLFLLWIPSSIFCFSVWDHFPLILLCNGRLISYEFWAFVCLKVLLLHLSFWRMCLLDIKVLSWQFFSCSTLKIYCFMASIISIKKSVVCHNIVSVKIMCCFLCLLLGFFSDFIFTVYYGLPRLIYMFLYLFFCRFTVLDSVFH